MRLAKIDTIAALNVAFFVNAAMLVVAGTVFFHHVNPNNLDIQSAPVTLAPILGSLAAVVFGIGLLASGLSSTATGTMAGQVVLQGFLNVKVEMWLWRLLTMIPALFVTSPLVQLSPGSILVLSQVVLSMQLPFTVVAVVLLTRRRDLMGDFVNTPFVNVINVGVCALVTALNVWLLLTL